MALRERKSQVKQKKDTSLHRNWGGKWSIPVFQYFPGKMTKQLPTLQRSWNHWQYTGIPASYKPRSTCLIFKPEQTNRTRWGKTTARLWTDLDKAAELLAASSQRLALGHFISLTVIQTHILLIPSFGPQLPAFWQEFTVL